MYLKIERLDKDLHPSITTIFETKEITFSFGTDGEGHKVSFLVDVAGKFLTFENVPEDRAKFFIMNDAGKTIDSMFWTP